MRPRLAWKREWTWILIVFLSLRLITSALGVNAIADGLPEPLGASESMFAAIAPLHTGPLSQALVNVWLRWDTPWYLKIAASGYAANDGSIAFMPLYPWLIKLVGTLLGGNFLLGAILLSNLAGLMALILLYELARLESSYKTNAMQTVLGMLTTSAGRGKAKASLLQPAGLAVLLPGAAMLAYQAWLIRSNLGSISQTLVTQWGIRTVMPWEGFRLFLVRLFSEPRVFIDYIDLGILLLMLAVCIYGTFRLDPAYSLYNWLNLALFFMRGTPPHLLDSFSRYLLLLFPAFLVFGALRDRRLALVFGLLSFIVQLFLVMGFLDWRWVA